MENKTINSIGSFLGILPNNPLINPIIDQETICHIAHIPIPSIIFDKKVVSTASNIAATGPKNSPHIIIREVTG